MSTSQASADPYEVGMAVVTLSNDVYVHTKQDCEVTRFPAGSIVTITAVDTNATKPLAPGQSTQTIPVSERRYAVSGVLQAEFLRKLDTMVVSHTKLLPNPEVVNGKEVPYEIEAITKMKQSSSLGDKVLKKGDMVMIIGDAKTNKGSKVYSTTSLSFVQYEVAKVVKRIESATFVGKVWVLHRDLAPHLQGGI